MRLTTMLDDRKPPSAPTSSAGAPDPLKQVATAPAGARSGDEAYQALRRVGGRAWQLHAATRAADHYIAQDAAADRNTGSWLVACAVDLAAEVAAELDALARTLKDRTSDGLPLTPLQRLRFRAHKLYASARAADHFLDQDSGEDRITASWLVATALDLAAKLAAEMDDEASQLKRKVGGADAAAFSDALSARKGPAAVRSTLG